MHVEDKLKTEGDAMDDIFEANYDRTRRKRVHDFTKPSKPSPVRNLQEEKWYLPVTVKGGKFYSVVREFGNIVERLILIIGRE